MMETVVMTVIGKWMKIMRTPTNDDETYDWTRMMLLGMMMMMMMVMVRLMLMV